MNIREMNIEKVHNPSTDSKAWDLRHCNQDIREKSSFLRQNATYYLLGFFFILGMKYFYGRAGSEELRWILAPTTHWVEILSGIPFTYERGLGYVNHDFRFLIAPSCSGVQFMIITAATLLFSFVHRMEDFLPLAYASPVEKALAHCTENFSPAACAHPAEKTHTHCTGNYPHMDCDHPAKKAPARCTKDFPSANTTHSAKSLLTAMKLGWTGASLLLSYLFTVAVNGLRILAAIYVPDYLDGLGVHNAFLTDDRLHTIIGVTVYFLSLLSIYRLVESNFDKIRQRQSAPILRQIVRGFIPPVFWYFFVVLGIPFLNRACEKQPEKYTEFALLITGCCAAVLLLYGLILGLRKHMREMASPERK